MIRIGILESERWLKTMSISCVCFITLNRSEFYMRRYLCAVGDAVAAAGLGADDLGFQLPAAQSAIDMPITSNHGATEIR
jgi:hypothetical protein